MQKEHIPVLLHEVTHALQVAPGKRYIDATVGFGGHAVEIVKRGGVVLGIDRDAESLKQLEIRKLGNYEIDHKNLILVQGSFADIKRIAEEKGFHQVDGILFDLGFSSWQIDQSGRGFSFMQDEPLDLRFDQKQTKTTGADVLNTYSRQELETIFARYGELEQADKLAEALVKNRPVWRTSQLNALIARTQTDQQINRLLARIYQALRITVNEELTHVEIGLSDGLDLLKTGGRICVISFHSLEDRIVKLAFKTNRVKRLTKKPITPTQEEIQNNSRSRSAKLRIAVKI